MATLSETFITPGSWAKLSFQNQNNDYRDRAAPWGSSLRSETLGSSLGGQGREGPPEGPLLPRHMEIWSPHNLLQNLSNTPRTPELSITVLCHGQQAPLEPRDTPLPAPTTTDQCALNKNLWAH